MAERLNGQECAADRANDGMDRVPHGIDPRDLVGKKFERIQNASDADDPWIAEDLEGLVLSGQGDPVEVNGQPGGQNRQVQIDPGQRSQAKRHRQQIQSFHAATI